MNVTPASRLRGSVGGVDCGVAAPVLARADAEPYDEVAMWTANTSIDRILARFVHAGMQAGLDDEEG